MSYGLGVDLGTTRTAAAVHRDGVTAVVTLGVQSATMPSAVFVPDDAPALVGEAALRRGLAEPTRVAREFKRRVGDSEPRHRRCPVVSDRADDAPARCRARDHQRAGGWTAGDRRPHPPGQLGSFKTGLLAEAARASGLGDATLGS